MTCRLNRIVLAVLCATGIVAQAQPYRPAHDSEIVEELPRGGDRGVDPLLRALQQLHSRDPLNLDVALRLAQAQIAAARASSDPRRWGQAQATLAPWWEQASPPPPVLLLRATIRQSRHEFAAAIADLQQLLARQPTQAQAWLDLAGLQQVSGDLAAAARSCEQVIASGAAQVGAVCAAQVAGSRGQARASYATLDGLLSEDALRGQPAAARAWALTLTAELAGRLGQAAAAERRFRESLAVQPNDAYTLAAFADFLLEQQRPTEVLELIVPDSNVDALLLRRAQAELVLGHASASRSANTLAQRFAALRDRGDRVHLREESRYYLSITQQPDLALAAAIENWALQKEPVDARLVLDAAVAAGQPAAADAVLAWLQANDFEDVRLAKTRAQVRP